MKYTLRDAPCVSCPYRKDCPSGVWVLDEYEKLMEYDNPTWAQPTSMFLCHDGDRDSVLCRGWYETHGRELLAVRLLVAAGQLCLDDIGECTVECFASGFEAASHGIREIDNPSREAVEMGQRLRKKHPDLKEG